MTPTSRPRLLPALSSGYLWIFVGALGLRYVYLWQALRNNELLTYPVVDARVYVDWAHDFLVGKWLWYEAKTYTPGVPLWLAGWFAVLGERPWLHFAVFHLLGAIQAVLLGKTAELLWNRRAGLATGWLAAVYWPLVLFEATYYAEPLASLGLTVMFYVLARWQRGRGQAASIGAGALLAAGLALGCAIFARANLMLCAPVAALWVFLVAARRAQPRRWGRGVTAAVLLAIPSLLMCAPVALWVRHVTGVFEIRTGGWLSVFLGNNPEYRGLVVPVGVRWSDFVYQPIRAGKIERTAQNEFWRDEVFRVIREQPAEWRALMLRKAVMLTGRFEISQEIDIQKFRAASSVLSSRACLDWAALFGLWVVAAVAMLRAGEARRGWPLLAFAIAYMISISPVQAAGRYRLPIVIPMLPLAGWALAVMIQTDIRRGWPRVVIFGLAVVATGDWLDLAKEKIINHDFLLGLKREEAGDDAGAERAFAAGAAWNPADPDCPYRLGQAALRHKAIAEAEMQFTRALTIFPRAYEAVLGQGEAALAGGRPEDALRRVDEALRLAPNNRNALALAARAHLAKRDWKALGETYSLMRGHPQSPAALGFAEARAWVLAGQPGNAINVLDEMVSEPWHTNTERGRALFLGGALAWRFPAGQAVGMQHWEGLAAQPSGFFPLLAQLMTGKKMVAEVQAMLPPAYADEAHLRYTLALLAMKHRETATAKTHLEAVVAKRKARELPEGERELLEMWALEDLAGVGK